MANLAAAALVLPKNNPLSFKDLHLLANLLDNLLLFVRCLLALCQDSLGELDVSCN